MPYLHREQLAGMGVHYMYYPFDYFLKCQEELGFLTMEMWCWAPHFLLDDYGYQNPLELKKKAEDHGLKIGVFAPECTMYQYLLCAHEETARKHAFGYFKNGILAAEAVGAGIMPISCCGGDWNEEPERIFDRAVQMLAGLAPIAEAHHVTLAVETVRPEESRVVCSLSGLQKLLEAVGHPNVKAAFNLPVLRSAGESLEEWFGALGDKICHAHFSDGRPNGQLVWGDGLFCLEDELQVLNDYHYEGYLGQRFTDGRYFSAPRKADQRNMAAFEPFFI